MLFCGVHFKSARYLSPVEKYQLFVIGDRVSKQLNVAGMELITLMHFYFDFELTSSDVRALGWQRMHNKVSC